MRHLRSWQIFLICLLPAPAALAVDVRICTDEGIVDLSLDERAAPLHVANFMRYLESGYYNGTVFHRVVSGSMVQGGGYDQGFQRRRPGEPVRDESSNRLSNRRGTIAASRGQDPDSATSQFFINLADNTHLDASAAGPGFTVFGRVTGGIEALDRIAARPTRRVGELEDVPTPVAVAESVTTRPRAAFLGVSVESDPDALQADFDRAAIAGEAQTTLAAVDALRRACITLTPRQYMAEAEAALALGNNDRARYGLEQYLATAAPRDPLRARAQQLLADQPVADVSHIDERIAHCREPVAPSIPDGRTAELETLRAVEGEVMRYRQLGQLYLTCVSQVLNGGTLNELETLDATDRYNRMVIDLTATATRFNESVREFKALQ